jgi:hypothetical protein
LCIPCSLSSTEMVSSLLCWPQHPCAWLHLACAAHLSSLMLEGIFASIGLSPRANQTPAFL